MSPKDIIQTLKSGLERESQFEDKTISTHIEYCDKLAKATIMQYCEGKWISFEVLARPLGISEALKFD